MLIRYESLKQAESVKLEQPNEIDAGIIDDCRKTVWKFESDALYYLSYRTKTQIRDKDRVGWSLLFDAKKRSTQRAPSVLPRSQTEKVQDYAWKSKTWTSMSLKILPTWSEICTWKVELQQMTRRSDSTPFIKCYFGKKVSKLSNPSRQFHESTKARLEFSSIWQLNFLLPFHMEFLFGCATSRQDWSWHNYCRHKPNQKRQRR